MHWAYCPLPRCVITNDGIVWGHSGSGFSSHGPEVSYSSWIRHLGAMQEWPNLQGCTGATLGVADVGADTGATFWTAGVCGFGVAGIVGETGRGCGSCAGAGRCRQWCRYARSGRSLQCGCCDIWGSVSGLDTMFTKVSSCVVVDHTITGAQLVAVFWQDTYVSGRNPDLPEGVIHCNRLAGMQGCKGFVSFVCLWLGGIGMGINLFTNLEGCWVSVAESGRNGGPNLVLVQELSRWWELGINGCSLEHQKGELWVSAAVLSTLECMLHRFYTFLSKSIWLQVVRAWGLICDTPRGAKLSELCTHILRALVRAEYFGNSVLWEHLCEQWENFDSVALARWKMSDEDHLE